MKYLHIIGIIITLIMVAHNSSAFDQHDPYTMPTVENLPPQDKPFFVIYAVGNDVNNPYPLPQYWQDIWDITSFPSIPGYLSDITNGTYILNAVPLGTDGVSGGNCFRINEYPTPDPINNFPYQFAVNAVMQAADLFDFRPYADNNNTVYGILLIPVEGINHGIPQGPTITTNQILPTG